MDGKLIGERLRGLRGSRSQQEVAEALGVTKMAISQYERGVRIPNDMMKMAIAQYFGQSVESIFFAA